MPGRTLEPGTTYICGTHHRLTVPVRFGGGARMRHAGSGDHAWCGSERFTERTVREVDRETALGALAGEDGDHDR